MNLLKVIALVGLCQIYATGVYAVEGTFSYQVKLLSLPEEILREERLFLDPEQAASNWFGDGLTVGDWNRDGHNDIFISSFLADPDGVANAGAIHVFLGPDFNQTERITALPAPEEGDNFGIQIDWHDMNNDQNPDLIVTGLRSRFYPEDGSALLNNAGSFRVIWGPDFTDGIRMFDEYPEANATLGRGLAVADFNRDGNQDIALGGIGAYGNYGKVILRYGPDFIQQQELFSPVADPGMRFGANLAVGDWDADGDVDLMVGVDYATGTGGVDNAGHVEIIYGPDYKEEDVTVLEEPHPAANNNMGAALDFGDLTGDGIPDLVVGKSGAQWEGKGWVGQVLIFVGPDYEETIELNSPQRGENCIFGSEVKIADVNNDQVNDLVVGEYYATVDGIGSAGRAWLFLGIKTSVRDWTVYE